MHRRSFIASTALALAGTRLSFAAEPTTPEGRALRDALLPEVERPVKPAWRPMMRFLAELHGRSIFPPLAHFKYPYQSIGPGYEGGRVFGHIDLAHERLDTVRSAPEHVRRQIVNELAGQQADGLIPGIIIFNAEGKPWWKDFKGFPPFWVVAAEEYFAIARDDTATLPLCLAALRRQIAWFEAKRSVPGGGFYYLDQKADQWESGMDEGVRYLARPAKTSAAVDACAHVFMLYDHAARWSRRAGENSTEWERKAAALRDLIHARLWDERTGFFYDDWVMQQPGPRTLAFEGMWPVVMGAASEAQARRVIEEHLLNPKEFFTPHPIATVALNDPKFERRMWRGPAWNCMTLWAARGCHRYGNAEGARRLLEAALDATAAQFTRSGTLWEFFDPQLGPPERLDRKPHARKTPWPDYIGHNPLFAMADLWRRCGGRPAAG